MFRYLVPQTEFSTGKGADTLSNICFVNEGYYPNDVTFVSALRAILGDLLLPEERINVWHKRIPYSYEMGEYQKMYVDNLAQMIDAAPSFSDLSNTLVLYGVESRWDDFEKGLGDKFTEYYPDYTRKMNITHCYKSICGAMGFYNETKKNAIVFFQMKDLQVYHAIQMSFLFLMPWLFSPKELPDWKMAIVNAYNDTTKQSYMTAIHNAAAHYDFRTGQIRRMLFDFETKSIKAEMERVKSSIETMKRDIDSHFSEIGSLNRNIDEKLTVYLGLQARSSNNQSTEMMDFFLDNKCLDLLYCRGSGLEFLVKTKLYNFDEDSVEDMLNNTNSYLYTESRLKAERTRAFFKAIFLDKVLKIRMSSQYFIDIESNEAQGPNRMRDAIESDPTYYPNPHVYHYNCLGSNRQSIVQLLQDGNYQGAISQCIYSAGNINISDATVITKFVREITNMEEDRQFIELPDGTIVSPPMAIKWLEDNGMVENEAA